MPATTSGAPLAIRELTFFEGDRAVMHLAPNGHVEMSVKHVRSGGATTIDNQFIGVIGADGSISDPSGRKTSMLESDGTVSSPDGRKAPFKLDVDALVVSGSRVTIDDHGGVLKNGQPIEPAMRVDGATDAGARRAALLLLALVLSSPGPQSTTPSP